MPPLLKAGLIFGYVALGLFGTQAFAHDETPPDVNAGSSAIDQRLTLTRSTNENRFAIASHKSNYLLPLTLTTEPGIDDGQVAEIKFQFSLAVPLRRELFNTSAFAAFGYTNQSYWQAYNSGLSSPFTETNHEPELFVAVPYKKTLMGFSQRGVIVGVSHQSNGRTPPFSRSWNRLYADFLFERGNTYFSFKTWYRIPEEQKEDILQAEGDDNPDIEDYLGKFELTTLYKHGGHSLSALLRHTLNSDNRGALQIDYDFPMSGKLNLTAHFFSGYGESLITYDKRVQRLGIGFRLSNWL